MDNQPNNNPPLDYQPPENKRFPWGWVAAGCGVLAALVLALFIFVALPAVHTLFASPSPVQGQNPLPLIGSTAMPAAPTDPGGAGGKSVGGLPFIVSAVQDPTTMPTQSLFDQIVTTLNLNTDTDFMAPKSYKGSAMLDGSAPFTLGNAWCASDAATLRSNLANMQFTLSINGNVIDLSQYPTLSFTDNSGAACAMTGIAFTPSGALSGSYHVVLTQKYLTQLSDGITSSPYPAGDVIFDFNIQFPNSTPMPGGSI